MSSRELSRFIAAGRLNCKIDKVGGVVETNRYLFVVFNELKSSPGNVKIIKHGAAKIMQQLYVSKMGKYDHVFMNYMKKLGFHKAQIGIINTIIRIVFSSPGITIDEYMHKRMSTMSATKPNGFLLAPNVSHQ